MNRREMLRYTAALPCAIAAALPDEALYSRDPEKWWARVRAEQFSLPEARVFMNNGSLGVTPKPVMRAVTEYLERSASLELEEYPRWGYETLDAHREELARFVGCTKDELAIMHNATEAMCTIAGGLDLKAGDEVVITDQEHPSGRGCWQQKRARYGIALREVPIPLPPKSPEQLVDLLIGAIGPKTRVLSFSGITSPTGLIMPVREICAAARAKGVLTVVDGAHMHGQVATSIAGLGCDFFAGSPHKWLFAPAGCGLMYVREEHLDRLWANTLTADWNDKKAKAARFMMVGTNNRAIIEGMMAGLRFHQQLGSERVYGRIHELARMVRRIAAGESWIELLTPDDDRMYGSLVGLKLRGVDYAKMGEICKKRRIWTFQRERLRVSVHVHTRPSDIEALFQALRDARG